MAFFGLFGNGPQINPNQRYGDGFDPVSGAMSLSGGGSPPTAAQQVARGGDGIDPSTMRPSPLQNFVGRLNSGVNSALATLGNPAAMQREQMQNAALQALRQQQFEGQRQMAVKQFEAANPQPTTLQRNYEYLKLHNPALAETYLRAEANPMTLTTDPLTGNLRFTPKGGDPSIAPMPGQAQGPITKTIGAKTYYSPNGTDWYDNPGMQ